MKKRKISMYLILLALGAVLPFMLENGLNLKENMFLLMHIPLFLISVTFGGFSGALSGILIPVLYCVFKLDFDGIIMLPLTIVPCIFYGIFAGLLYLKKNKNIYLSLGISMIIGRIVYIIIYFVYKLVLKKADVDNVFLDILWGIPGIILQFILVPVFTAVIYKKIHSISKVILDNGISNIETETLEFIIVKNNRTVFKSEKHDVKELITLYEEEPSFFKDAIVIAKEMGKDTALILVLGGVKAIYVKNISVLAFEALKMHKVFLKYESIKDLWHDPFEKHIMEINDPAVGYAKVKAKYENEEEKENE